MNHRQTAHRYIRTVKYTGCLLLLAFFIYDFFAHLTNFLKLPFQVGLQIQYGTQNYELVASLILGLGLVITLITILSHGVDLALQSVED